jgi:hypothetical protein
MAKVEQFRAAGHEEGQADLVYDRRIKGGPLPHPTQGFSNGSHRWHPGSHVPSSDQNPAKVKQLRAPGHEEGQTDPRYDVSITSDSPRQPLPKDIRTGPIDGLP